MPKRITILLTDSQRVFAASPVNGGYYVDPGRPLTPWRWPERTWLKQRLEYVRIRQKYEQYMRKE